MAVQQKLALGTVQFGMAYGATHDGPPPGQAEVRRILECAAAAGIDVLDSAAAYGEAEAVLGTLSDAAPHARVVTKLSGIVGATPAETAAAAADQFGRSLHLLRRESLYGVLAHHAGDLLGGHGDALWQALERLRDGGLVQRIGVSVYTPDEVETLLERYPLGLVQVPRNVLDGRFVARGTLERLAAAGVEVHVRSAFLQGVLLARPEDLRPGLAGLRPHIARLAAWAAEAGLSPLVACLAPLVQDPAVARVVVGCQNAAQLEAIIAAADAAAGVAEPLVKSLATDFAVQDDALVNPGKWS